MKKVLCMAVAAMVFACAAQAADFSKLPDPTKNVKAGQWVSYKVMGGMEQKHSITNVEGSGDDRVITLKMETIMNGQAMGGEEQKIPLKNSRAAQEEAWKAAPDAKISDVKVTVNGKEYDAVLLEMTNQGMTTKMYMSEKVPVTGIVKMEVTGMPGPMMELVDFGG